MAIPLHVLIVEDSEDDALLLLHELRKAGFDPSHERVDTEAAVLAALEKPGWELVLSDFAMGGFNGLAAFELVKRSGVDVPFIFVSGHIGEEQAAEAMRKGASDYVLKGNLARLIPAIQRELDDAEVRRQRKQMERTLQEREFQLSSIYDTVADVIFQLAVEGEGQYRFVSVNKTFTAVTGLENDRVVGRTVNEIIPEPSRRLVLEKYAEAIREKRILRWEETTEYPTGRVSGEVSIAPIFNDTGACTHLVGAVHDITARKEAEDRLRENEERYRRLVEGSLQGIAIVQDQQVVFCNQAFAGMLGYDTPAEVVGKPFTELVAPQELARIQGYHEARLAGREVPGRYEYRALRKDGSLAWIEREAHLMEWDGRTAVQTSNIDVSERMRAEERFAAIFENSQDVIALINAEARFTLVSPAVSARLGFAPEELLGQSVYDFVHPEDHSRVQERLAKLIPEPGAEALEEVRFRHKDGSWRAFEAVGKNLLDNPAVEGVLGVLREITERKELQAQLLQAQKMEAIGSLAGGVAHDFNNLLSVILSYSGFLLDKFEEGDPGREDVQEIQAAGTRASALTRQLLAFSRRQVLKLEVLDLNDILRNMERMLTRLIREDIVLLFELDEKLSAVRADSGQVEQIVMNLAVNARDAMPAGGRVTIETGDVALDEEYVSHHLGAAPGDYVMLAVSDTGIGMDEEVRSRIFEPFFTTKEAGKGTGLGLATVYGIVKQLNGSIWVYSEPGQGTSFKVYLPRHAGSEAQRTTVQPAAAGGDETILVAEDEQSVRAAACRILRGQGYTVLEAGNGEEALKVLDGVEGKIDLVLTDVVMPVMGGHPLQDRLEMLNPDTPVLFMSGYTDEGIVNHGVLEEGVAFLQKPFTKQSLLQAVRTAIDTPKKG